ncbi:hypothetical protein Nepgr_000014 [Nepenthes gracilis]|uniref:E3 ubiquitin-protein ligase listerin n=1 Tax=Nepenthes gracilis TaxID=150966 RepID=A0AAD3RWA4_NEPGR|nr:hypothetical protein Nepgr_000014 [Nepenthes gracilis]
MGRQKGEAARTKARASSSSLAASLLPAGTSAVGFGGFVGSTRVDSTLCGEESTSVLDIDSEMSQHLKRLSRKDPTTKFKALSSLSMLLKQKSGKDVLPIVPQWAFEYKRLLMDYNREVRRATHDTMTNLVTAVGRGLALHLKSLMGPWWVSQFDSVSEVSEAAKQSFQAAFPTQERRIDALMFCTAEIFMHLEDNLKLTPESMSNLAAASDELAEMHQQVISSSLLALATLLDVLIGIDHERPVGNSAVQQKHVPKARATAISFAEKLFSTQKYFLDFLSTQSPTIRSATYSLLRSFIKNVPQVYSEGDMKTLATAILGAFQEVHPLCHSSMWEAILLFSERYPGSWANVNIQRTVLNRFWQFLRNGCFGSQQVSYPALVLFLDTLPPEAITAEKFFADFFQNLWAGRHISHPSNADRLAFFLAFKECFLWVLCNTSRYCNGENETSRVRMSLVENIIVKLLWHDFLFYVGSRNGHRVSYDGPGVPLEDSIQLIDKNTPYVKYSLGYLEDLGQCLIEIMSAMYALEHQLLRPFCEAFQGICLESFQQTDHLKRISESLGRVIKFITLLDLHAVQKAETWPLKYLVGPLLERSFPLVRSLDSSDFVKFLSVVISIFGPRRIIQKLFICDQRIPGGVTVDGDREANLVHFFQLFEGTFVPWCFNGTDGSTNERLDLLFALLDIECFSEQWNIIISYATGRGNLESVPISHIGSLTYLLEKASQTILERRSEFNKHPLQPEQWHHKLLDSAAVSIMHSVPLFGNSDAQFMRAVLGSGESDHAPFLSKFAIVEICQEAFRKLVAFVMASPFDWVRKFGSLLCNAANIPVLDINSFFDVSEMAKFALEVLDGGFLCLKSHCEEHELFSGIAASISIIDWECTLTTASGYAVSESSVDNFNTRLEFGESVHLFLAKISHEFWRSLNMHSRKILASILIRFVRSAIFENDRFNGNIVISLCCQWIVEVIKGLCLDQYEEQNVLDLLLSCDDVWPLWVMPDISSNKKQTTWKVESSTNVPASRNQFFVALVDKLISEIGFHKVVIGRDLHALITQEKASNQLVSSESATFYRAWLAAEMLCTWKWPSGGALSTFLPLLREDTRQDGFSYNESLFDILVNTLLDGALSYRADAKLKFFTSWPPSNDELDEMESPFLRALMSLLLTLFSDGIWGKKKAIAFFELLVNKLYIGNATNANCLHILPPLAYVLVQQLQHSGSGSNSPSTDSQSDSLRENIKDWLQKTLMFPPLISWKTGEDMKEWFQLVLSCYPLSIVENKVALCLERDISMSERKLLLDLFRKQRYDADGTVFSNELPVVMMLLSRLIVIAVGYCWEDFNEEDWEFVWSQLRCLIDTVVVVMEETVESLDLLLKNASSDKLKDAIDKFNQNTLAVEPSCMDSATNALHAYLLWLGLVQFQQTENSNKLTFLKMDKCDHLGNHIEEDVLRVFLSVCVAESISSTLHCESLSIIGTNHINAQFWELIASTVVQSSPLTRDEAIKSIERWGLSKGPISSLIALLFSSIPVYSLKFAAFVLLSNLPISKWIVITENASYSLNGKPASDLGSQNLDSSSEDGIVLREDVSCLIEKLPIGTLDIGLEAQERINVFLAWCLLLSHLLSLPSYSPERERLVHHIQESASSMILDMLFQHIPLELCMAHILKKRDKEIPTELSDVAAAASRAITTGSLLFVLESLWPIQPERMALLAAAMFGVMLRVLPAYVREWFSDIRDRTASSAIEVFTKEWCSPYLIADELSQIKEVNFADESFSVSVSKSANEVIATYTKDETGMDLVIHLPASYPLRPVDVECTRSLGITEVKQRKWLLSMMAFVRNQNGALAEAIRIWKHNFDKAFEGVEECPICYSVIHTTSHCLPRLACKTCKHKFHSACLYKWFSTAHKSTCPLCQSPF